MRRYIALLLAALMLTTLLGCSEAQPEGTEATGTEPVQTTAPQATTGETLAETENTYGLPMDGTIPAVEGFQVGYGRVDITPNEPMPISGLGRTSFRMSTSVHDTLYATCIAVTDEEGETVLMFTIDIQHSHSHTFDTTRAIIQEKTGIPKDHIFITATHTHSGPDQADSSSEKVLRYRDYLAVITTQAAYAAIADRKPATVSYGNVDTEGMNFVKHYRSKNADGTWNYFGDNHGTARIDETTEHSSEAYNTMHVVEFQRKEGKNIVLVNWRAHPHLFTSASSYKLSADFVGSFRTSMEDLYDCHFAYYQGAAGNVNTNSRLEDENKVISKDYGQYGYEMAKYCLQALENMTPAKGTDIKTLQINQELERNHEDEDLISIAIMVRAIWSNGGTFAESMVPAAGYPIYSPYHAGDIINRPKLKDNIISEINAFSIGEEIAVFTAPHELFDMISKYVEENSPYAFTMNYCYTNGANGYIPSAEAWEFGCYEADTSKVVRGTAEMYQELFLDMLNDLKSES